MTGAPSPQSAPPAPPLDTIRTRVVDLLSAHFAHDGISVEELDRRLDAAYQARSVPELEVLVSDVPQAGSALARISAALPAYYDDPYEEPAGEESERILSVMSETRRSGLWVVPRLLDVVCVMSETTLDLREASLAPGITTIRLSAFMAQVTIVVPPGTRIIDRTFAIMATSRDVTDSHVVADRLAPAIRIEGWAAMAEVAITRDPRKKSRWS